MAGTLLRVLWFCTVGWFFGIVWFLASLALMVSIVFLPIGAYTITKTWTVATLKRNPRKIVVEAQTQTDDGR